MANIDCYDTSIYNSTTRIVADPDVAGIGVIAAFTATAGLALVSSFVHTGIREWACDETFKNNWCPLLERLILALSDQQLLTGLAVLIAAFARWNTISIYHFEVATDLAFISSNTHIATLTVLRHSLREPGQEWVRVWRVVAMLVLFLLLFVSNAYSGYRDWDDSYAWPVRCAAAEMRRNLSGNFGGEPAKYMAVWTAYLLVDYPVAIAGLFKRVCDSTREWVHSGGTKAKKEYDTRKKAPSHSKRQLWRNKLLLGYWTLHRIFFAAALAWHTTTFFLIQDTAWYLYNVIVLFQLRNTLQSWLDEPSKENDATGFGQILPMIMLLLPIMALSEEYVNAFHGKKDATKRKRTTSSH